MKRGFLPMFARVERPKFALVASNSAGRLNLTNSALEGRKLDA